VPLSVVLAGTSGGPASLRAIAFVPRACTRPVLLIPGLRGRPDGPAAAAFRA
jgi:hypothetical protein